MTFFSLLLCLQFWELSIIKERDWKGWYEMDWEFKGDV